MVVRGEPIRKNHRQGAQADASSGDERPTARTQDEAEDGDEAEDWSEKISQGKNHPLTPDLQRRCVKPTERHHVFAIIVGERLVFKHGCGAWRLPHEIGCAGVAMFVFQIGQMPRDAGHVVIVIGQTQPSRRDDGRARRQRAAQGRPAPTAPPGDRHDGDRHDASE